MKKIYFFVAVMLIIGNVFSDTVKYQCNNCRNYAGQWWNWKALVNGAVYQIKLCGICTKLPKCSECYGRVAVYQHADKRFFCQECRQQGVFDQKQAQQIFDATRKYMKECWNIFTDHKIYFSLEDADFMKQFSNSYSNNPNGYFSPLGSGGKIRYRSGVEYDRPKAFRIRVMSGLPPQSLAGVIAHELVHDWVWEYVPQIIKYEQLNEGFAVYMQWLFLKNTGAEQLAIQQENRSDPVYGAGFRQMQQLMAECRNADDFKKTLLAKIK